jgi:hypothetical protein
MTRALARRADPDATAEIAQTREIRLETRMKPFEAGGSIVFAGEQLFDLI